MLGFLRGKASARKFRLFGCACVRRVWALLRDDRSRKAVITGELYADSLASSDETNTVWEAADDAARPIPGGPAVETATAYAAAVTVALWAPADWGASEAARWVRQCGLG